MDLEAPQEISKRVKYWYLIQYLITKLISLKIQKILRKYGEIGCSRVQGVLGGLEEIGLKI